MKKSVEFIVRSQKMRLGTITVDSKPGKGTVVKIYLSAMRAENNARRRAANRTGRR